MYSSELFCERIDSNEGKITDRKNYEFLGVHKDGEGYVFRTRQRNAVAVELTGDFNSWGGWQMKNIGGGCWEIRVESDIPLEGNCYKYKIYNEENCELKPDPYARYSQWGSHNASIVYFDGYEWEDGEWMEKREKYSFDTPLNIYQIHLGTWKRREGRSYSEGDAYLNYRDVAAVLACYVSDMGYTHVCLIGITEEGKEFGFAPTARYGCPDGLKLLVDTFHRIDIGVIFELGRDKADDSGSPETKDGEFFECASFWIREYHVDGLYLVGKTSKMARMKMKQNFPSHLFIFEDNGNKESEGVISDRRWTEEVLDYASSDPQYKRFKYSRINLSLTDGMERHRILPITYSDISKGQQSLINKMRGSYGEKFDRLRLFYCYMMTHPGKKLTFMGCEFGEDKEWSRDEPLEWFLLEQQANKKLKEFVKSLNLLYKESPELWKNDSTRRGFSWICPLDVQNGILAFKRLDGSDGELIAALNFTDNRERAIEINAEDLSIAKVFNSDKREYGGEGRGGVKRKDERLILSVPPLSAVIVKCSKNKKTPFFEKAIDYSSDV